MNEKQNIIEILFFVVVAIVMFVALWRIDDIPIDVIKLIAISTLLIYVLERLQTSLRDSVIVKQFFENYFEQKQGKEHA